MQTATLGQLLINRTLPEDMRDYSRVLDKKGLMKLLEQVARKHPDKYKDVSHKLNQIGLKSSQEEGGMSFGMRHLRRSKAANVVRKRVRAKLAKILSDDTLTPKRRKELIIRAVGSESEAQQKAILEEAIANKNPLAMQVLSGSRGKPMNLASLLGSDMLYSDHRDEVIPIPVLRSYSEGLSPEEYWAGTYGARRGIIATKFATQDAGFLSKQLNQAGHRLVVMGEDEDASKKSPYLRGMIADTDDMDNEGSLLATDTGPYKRNTPLTPKILKDLKRRGKARILIRSPLVGGSPEGGVYARDVGIRETGRLPGRGEQVGLQAAQALSEPISQGQLSAKHSGGVAGQEKAVGGFEYINQLIQTPKSMKGGAAHSTLDGTVQRIEDGPAGGQYVTINDEKHYVGSGFTPSVKKGDKVEAGDLLSDGIPNPGIITKYKGVGEGRRYFVNEFKKAMGSSGMRGHRRNIELLARGLINHVKITEETNDNAPDDIIPYSTIEHTYKPRNGHEVLRPKKAVGKFLERPVLHYTIGTKVRPSMLKDFEEFGVKEIPVHKNPPPFEPHMVRGMFQLQHDPDWMTQMYGSGLKKSLLESTARGATSKLRGTSFVPSLALGTDFGQVADRAVIAPQAGYDLPEVSPKVRELPKPASPPATPFFGGKFASAVKSAAEPAGVDTTKSDSNPASGGTTSANLDSNIMPKTTSPSPSNGFQSAISDVSTLFNAGSSSGPANLATTRSANMGTSNVGTQSIMPQQQAAFNDTAAAYPHANTTAMNPTNYYPGVPQQNPTTTPSQQQPGSTGDSDPSAASAVPAGNASNNMGMGNYVARQTAASSALNPGFQQGVKSLVTGSGSGSGTGLVQGSKDAVTGSLAKAKSFIKNPTAKGAAKGVARYGASWLPGALEGTAVGSAAGGAGMFGSSALATTIAPAIGGFVATNAITELVDAAGLLPQWAGGTGMGNVGWDQKGFDQSTRDARFGQFSMAGVLNPLKAITEIQKGQAELFAAGAGKIYDGVTGTTAASRHRSAETKKTQDHYAQRAIGLNQQIAAADSTLANGTAHMSAAQIRGVEDARRVAKAKIREGELKTEAASDETADWSLGNQHVFGDKGHKFRDAISSSVDQYGKSIDELSGLDSRTAAQEQQLQDLQGLRAEGEGYVSQYNNDNFSQDDFNGRIRNGVQSAKRMIAERTRQLEEPAIRASPEESAKAERELQYANRRLQMLRGWAESSR